MRFAQLVNRDSHRGELDEGNGTVDLGGDGVDLFFQILAILGEVFEPLGLDSKGHIHNLCRMSVAGGKVDKTPLGQEVEDATVGHLVAVDIGLSLPIADRQLLERLLIDLDIKMAAVGQENAVLHHLKMLAANDVAAAGERNKEIAHAGGLVHRKHRKAVHHGLDGLDGIDLGHDHHSAHSLGAHSESLAAPAVATYDHGLAGDDEIGGVHNAVEGWLISYSLYADRLGEWYAENVSADFTRLRAFAMSVLQEESELEEIVRLVGADALSYKDRLTMEIAKSIREDYLHQNAFHEVDTYASLNKQYKMLKLIYDFYRLANDALERDVDYQAIVNLSVREKIGRAKYIPEENISELDDINSEIHSTLKGMMNGEKQDV